MVAGAAAGVAAIFKAPATGAVFALEVPYQDDLARNMLLPALVSSAAGYLVFVGINGTTPLFPIEGTVELTMRDLLGAVACSASSPALGARAFAGCCAEPSRSRLATHPVLVALAAPGDRGACSYASAALVTASRSSSVRGTRSSRGPPSPDGPLDLS